MGSCCTAFMYDDLDRATLENTVQFSMMGHSGLVKVIDVYDGDTVTIAFRFGNQICQQKCRIDGLDCAEIRTKNEDEKKFGYLAKAYLTPLLFNKLVYARVDSADKFGRLLAKLWFSPKEDGERVDSHMIRKGFGYEYHGDRKLPFDVWFNTETGVCKTPAEIAEIRLKMKKIPVRKVR